MPKVVACVIARTVSSRLPLKVLRDLLPGISMLDFLIQRLKSVKAIDEIYVCTSFEIVDDVLEDVAARNGVKVYRGSPDAVIERMLKVGEIEQADILLRITGDNPLTSVEYIETQIKFLKSNNLDYVRVIDVPIGATAEVMRLDALKKCYDEMDPSVSEYLLLFIFNPKAYRCGCIRISPNDYSSYSVTVDTPLDLIRTKNLVEYLGQDHLSLLEIISAYEAESTDEKLPSRKIQIGGSIKMPYNQIITFDEFKTDMNSRAEQSEIMKLYE